MSDLIARLRDARCYHVGKGGDTTRWLRLRPDYVAVAADEIERLSALNKKSAEVIKVAHAALWIIAMSGNHVATKALAQIQEINDDQRWTT